MRRFTFSFRLLHFVKIKLASPCFFFVWSGSPGWQDIPISILFGAASILSTNILCKSNTFLWKGFNARIHSPGFQVSIAAERGIDSILLVVPSSFHRRQASVLCKPFNPLTSLTLCTRLSSVTRRRFYSRISISSYTGQFEILLFLSSKRLFEMLFTSNCSSKHISNVILNAVERIILLERKYRDT